MLQLIWLVADLLKFKLEFMRTEAQKFSTKIFTTFLLKFTTLAMPINVRKDISRLQTSY